MAKKTETKTEEKTEVSLSSWLRNLVMQRPDLTLEQLHEEFAKSGRPEQEKPDSMQRIYQAKNQIKNRWGVELSELPRNRDGSLNISGLVRLYLDKFGIDATEKKAQSYFAGDGIELKTGSFGNAKSTYIRKGSVDPNVGKGPRARFQKKSQKKQNRKPNAKKSDQMMSFDLLLQTKHYLEAVGGVQQARALMDFVEDIQSLKN